MPVPQEIARLLERYDEQREAYESGQYKETEIRVEFIDPFFKALGWDVHNEHGYAEAYKDVIHEEALKIGGATEAPDSCFRIGGVRKFFVECKKPSVNIKDATHPAYQLRRYGWSAKLPLSILTDFEEFAVYDCRVKPAKNDGAAVGRVLYLTYAQYAEKWNEIAAIFARESVLKGSFDKFAEGVKGKRGTTTVDNAFLEEMERWRDMLARNIAMRNPDLSQRELNFGVQRTIDRIVFLRICEDRGIEPYGRLMTLRNGERVYPRLRDFFQRADERYNSGLFHFQREKDRPEAPDELTLTLNIDDNVLRDILANLYYPESPYEFSVLSSDILGQVYERFLGKVIRLTAGHQAKVEEKPEVRKAGGVFYTPDFITKAIVRQTIGPLLEDKTPRQVAKLRFCDMACGSGSFLIEAFQFILDWHRDWYAQSMKLETGNVKGGKSPLYHGPGGDWRLTTEERKRILLNNIFGVDIDAQAVEVTKLSLLLKVLEGESQQSITKQYELFHQRALPDLGSNIKCGNSLIGSETCKLQQLSLLPEEDRYRINIFDWERAFPEVFKVDAASSRADERKRQDAASTLSGFDAIIGNPPYIRIQTMKEWAPVEVELYKELFQSAAAGNYDIYVVFVEKALRLLNKSGRLGFILPHKFFNAQYGEALREIIATGKHLAHVIHFGDQQVFSGATTYTCLMFLDKAGANECLFEKVTDLYAWRHSVVDTASSRVEVERKRQDAASTTPANVAPLLPTYFDSKESIAFLKGNLPHWRQRGATYFVTFRTTDSMPREKLEQWQAERDAWLQAHPEPCTETQRQEYHDFFVVRFQKWLDAGFGTCPLKDTEARNIVENALKCFDGDRYRLGEYVVMPNHVHVLITPLGDHTLSNILHSWKSYTANEINKTSGKTGAFWQKESFDHIVRNPEQLERIRNYIRANPLTLPVDAASSRVDERKRQDAASTAQIPAKTITAKEWNFAVGAGAALVGRLRETFKSLGEVADIFVGLQTSADDVFIMNFVDEAPHTIKLRSVALGKDWVFEKALLHPVVSGQDVSGYTTLPERQFIIFPYAVANEKASLIPFADIEKNFPKTAQYLLANKDCLAERERGKMKGPKWHGFVYLKNMTRQSVIKVCVPRLVDELCAAYDGDGSHFLDNVDVGGITFKTEFVQHDLRYLVALLNSRLLRWFFPYVSAPFRGGWYSANRQFLSQVPFRPIDFSKPAEKNEHDKLVSLVDQITTLHRQAVAAKSPPDKEALERQIRAATREIDRLVYELYGLTEEEIGIVENAAQS